MSGFDEGRVFYSDQNILGTEERRDDKHLQKAKYRDFIRNYKDNNLYIYRDQLRTHYLSGQYFLDVSLEHLIAYDNKEGSELANFLQQRPAEFFPLFEDAAKDVVAEFIRVGELRGEDVHDIQVVLKTSQNPKSLRDLQASDVSKLVVVPGIVIGASKVRAKATHIQIMCRNCRNVKVIPCRAGFGGATLPRVCDRTRTNAAEAPCPLDPYVMVGEKSKYVDQQTLKLQERPEMVPTGEMPRSILLSVDRTLVGQVVPGTRLTAVGIFCVHQTASKLQNKGAVATRTSYIRAVGLHVDAEGSGRSGGLAAFTADQEEDCRNLARDPNIYETIVKNIAPAIFGYENIKKAIACLLFSGSRKQLPDGLRIRGDINVLLLGDPSTAKSQFLKFVEKVAPIGVYTSGKGSSAAGLTAAVIRDPSSGEFLLEGGAMVLADGGVVCIDEFDKMRNQDRVAIHEAMEQQTISIAKAGITTILNSRTSVLAAANPTFGSYDDMKSPEENIEFQSTILSRFDLIFIIRDVREEGRDRRVARHVLGVHMKATAEGQQPMQPSDQDHDLGSNLELLKRYIAFCRSRCAPRLTADAAQLLGNHYVSIRADAKKEEEESGLPRPIPITVRQLEAVVRISEALAKMNLSADVTESHVKEAIRLFKVSTLDAANTGVISPEGQMRPEDVQEIEEIESFIKKNVAIRRKMRTNELLRMMSSKRFNERNVLRTLRIMMQRGELEYLQKRSFISRLR